jgi:hypothetical protein
MPWKNLHLPVIVFSMILFMSAWTDNSMQLRSVAGSIKKQLSANNGNMDNLKSGLFHYDLCSKVKNIVFKTWQGSLKNKIQDIPAILM